MKTIHEFLIELPDRHLALYDIEICNIIKRRESSFEYSVYKNIHDKNMMEVRLLAETGAVRAVKHAIETELGLLVIEKSEG